MSTEVGRDFHVAHQMSQQGLSKLELFPTLGTLVIPVDHSGNERAAVRVQRWVDVVVLLAMLKGTGPRVRHVFTIRAL